MALLCKKALYSWGFVSVLFIAVLAADYFSKICVIELFHQDEPQSAASLIFTPISVFDLLGVKFSIAYAENTGAAWGAFEEFPNLLLAARVILVSLLVWYLVFRNKHPEWRLPLALIIAGACGNIIDFFLYGHVVDMFSFTFWGFDYPVFNVADSSIFIGALLIFIMSMRSKHGTSA